MGWKDKHHKFWTMSIEFSVKTESNSYISKICETVNNVDYRKHRTKI